MVFLKKQQGFTLVELMVVVVILGVLSAYAILNYQAHVLRTKRTECQAVMTSMATELERRFARNNQYSNTPALTGAGAPFACREYTLSVAIPAGGQTYTISAAANTVLQQSEPCTQSAPAQTLTLDNQGQKVPNSAGCW